MLKLYSRSYHKTMHVRLHMLGHCIPATISFTALLLQNWFELLFLFLHVPPALFQRFTINSYLAPSGDSLYSPSPPPPLPPSSSADNSLSLRFYSVRILNATTFLRIYVFLRAFACSSRFSSAHAHVLRGSMGLRSTVSPLLPVKDALARHGGCRPLPPPHTTVNPVSHAV